MFVGHYAAAMAAKAVEPKAPMWTLATACQLVDIGWSVFIMTGVERARVDPSLPGSTLVLYDMPWTHSLPMTFVWSIGAALLARWLLRLPLWASVAGPNASFVRSGFGDGNSAPLLTTCRVSGARSP